VAQNNPMADTYKTITAKSEGLYKEKGSKFLSFAHPVASVDDVKEIVKDYQKRFFDARHVCYAYMIGSERTEFRANDDGEPSGTAGRPILGQINSRELTNVLVVVIRYFGGILLGTGGLITAYKEATIEALNQANVVEKTIDVQYDIAFDYLLMNDVMRIVKDTNAQIVSQAYENECLMILSIRKQEAEILRSKLDKLYGLKFVEP
jgi:uncharacterized YigZ family protein